MKAEIEIKYSNGRSLRTYEGGEARILTNPDAPTDLSEDNSKRTSNSMGIKWKPPSFLGGDIKVSYNVYEKYQGGSEYRVKINKLDPYFIIVGCTVGTTYFYKV